MSEISNSKAPTSGSGTRNGIRDLHVKAIPEATWIRARCNATRSGLSFKDYLIRILDQSLPLTNEEPSVPSAGTELPWMRNETWINAAGSTGHSFGASKGRRRPFPQKMRESNKMPQLNQNTTPEASERTTRNAATTD